MRKLVRPAEGARIFDPDHMNFLPPEGIPLEATPHWLHQESQSNVTLEDLPSEPPPTPEQPDPPSAG